MAINKARLAAAILAARASAFAIQKSGRGGGTSLPGHVAMRIHPGALATLAEAVNGGIAVVAGTNGKTTTSRMLADILAANGMRVIHNRAGSNLYPGIMTAFTTQATPGGQPGGDVAVLEVDEGALPAVVAQVQPRVIVLTNLFRDQLDRFGELDTIRRTWRAAFASLPATTTIVFNADDPGLSAVVRDAPTRKIPFGLTEKVHVLDDLPLIADARTCSQCGHDLAYHEMYFSHLGNWHCPACGQRRDDLIVAGSDIDIRLRQALELTIRASEQTGRYHIGVAGFYNAYNAIAALAAGIQFGAPDSVIRQSLASYQPAFGRAQSLTYKGRELTMTLSKNPTGLNEVLRMYAAEDTGPGRPTLIAINDKDQDGRDISWLWDVDFEVLAESDRPLFTTGLRGPDMANRLKYAGVNISQIHSLPTDLEAGLDAFIESIPESGKGYILSTYTAMMELHDILARRGVVTPFWDQ